MKRWSALPSVALAAAMVVGVAGCAGGSDDPEPPSAQSPSAPRQSESSGGDDSEPEEKGALAQVKGEGGIVLKVTSAVRNDGGFLTLEGEVTNGTGKAWTAANWRGDERELVKNGGSIAGATLVDNKGKKKYLILRDTEGRCLCTRFQGLLSGDTAEWFAQFPAPPLESTEVSFQVGSMPPATIEISEG
ncbi:hypothetical protein ABZ628_00730 [Streptomyces diastaticus]|uniref:hypothetical protein n=2 Tax=Streptomyces TaxID=1883 RepID=UPI0013BBC248|nr:hypothetical protein [Streptomyces sp. DSM 41037]MDQ0295408.1 hypothetical protein [Streptomyces sp. DSM 41037]NEC14964.1 hypothetical protein [Streptomyces sp. SID8014]